MQFAHLVKGCIYKKEQFFILTTLCPITGTSTKIEGNDRNTKNQDKNNKSVQTKKKVVGRFSVAHKMSLSQQKARTFVVQLFLFSSLDEGVGVLR